MKSVSKLHMPEDMCPVNFHEEILFWGIGKRLENSDSENLFEMVFRMRFTD